MKLELLLSGEAEMYHASTSGVYLLQSNPKKDQSYPSWKQKSGNSYIWFSTKAGVWGVGQNPVFNTFNIHGPNGDDRWPQNIFGMWRHGVRSENEVPYCDSKENVIFIDYSKSKLYAQIINYYRVFQLNFPIDSSKITIDNGEI